MNFYIRLSPNNAKSEIVIGGIPLKNVTRIEAELQSPMDIPQIRLDLALSSDDVIIHGDGTINIGDLHVPSEFAYKIYEKLKEHFEEVK